MSDGKPGRPTVMTEEMRNEICRKLAGGDSLRSICRDPAMPHMSTVLLAVVQDRDGFSDQYMCAREAAGFAHADKVADLADEAARQGIDPQAARAAMDGFKWAAERMAPKRHSQRQEVDHTSSDGSMSPVDPRELTDEQLAAIAAAANKG